MLVPGCTPLKFCVLKYLNITFLSALEYFLESKSISLPLIMNTNLYTDTNKLRITKFKYFYIHIVIMGKACKEVEKLRKENRLAIEYIMFFIGVNFWLTMLLYTAIIREYCLIIIVEVLGVLLAVYAIALVVEVLLCAKRTW